MVVWLPDCHSLAEWKLRWRKFGSEAEGESVAFIHGLKQGFIWALRQGSHALCLGNEGSRETLLERSGALHCCWKRHTIQVDNWAFCAPSSPFLQCNKASSFSRESHFFQWLFPGQWLALGMSKDFSYVQYLCPLLGCFFSPSTEFWGKCGLPISAEVMPHGHIS